MKTAVIEAQGSQFNVKEGDIIKVNHLGKKAGENVEFSEILLAQDEKGLITDKGILKKIKVTGEVIGDMKDKKIHITRYKSKTGYKRTTGHRQNLTKVKIKEIKI